MGVHVQSVCRIRVSCFFHKPSRIIWLLLYTSSTLHINQVKGLQMFRALAGQIQIIQSKTRWGEQWETSSGILGITLMINIHFNTLY